VSARGWAAILLSLSALALAASGCGGDDEGDKTEPSISVPQTVEPTIETTTDPATSPTATAPGGKLDPRQPDSPTNDVPPPAGSPEEQFERFCEQNPGACG
jgi:hypothetical protein